ncbi:hypothetical protein CTV95_05910 [Pectobacterium brasiliense]|nr:hypothetical protein CTV95_05910 [Pectobacterium brasiliense]PXB02546.1 hypothetical protein DMB41_09290 [Pectobacterium carotovorum subsp. carotovorum]
MHRVIERFHDYVLGRLKVSGVLITVFFCHFITRPTRRAQTPQRLDHWLFGVNCAASRCLRRSYPLFGPSATRSLRGADFRGVHAAHPAATPTSAQFFTPTVATP